MPAGPLGLHIDRALSDVSIKYTNPSYVADVLAPPVKVNKESDKYYVYGKENFSIPPTLRADRAETKEFTWSLTNDQYFCEDYGLHGLVSDRERENADEALKPDIDTTEYITEALLIDREYRVANVALDSTNSGWQDLASSHFSNLALAWDDKVGAQPRTNIYYAKFVVFRDARRQANTVFMPVEVTYALSQMESVDSLRKYVDSGLLTNSGIPGVLWGLKVYECESTYNAAVEGSTTSSFTETFGANVIVAYINPQGMSMKSLTFMMTFQKQPFQTRKWREEKRKADVVEVNHLYDSRIVAPACGVVLQNVITPTVG